MITRRFLLAAPVVLTPGLADAAPGGPRLVMGVGPPAALAASLFLPGGAIFSCPPGRAALLAVLRMRGMEVAVISFAADPPGGTQDLLGFIGPDGGLLALERRFWRSQDEDELSSRFALLPDREHIALARMASRRDVPTRHSSWTDYLRCDAGRLVDAPAHAPRPGSWQAFLAAQRRDVAGRLLPAMPAVSPSLLAAFAVSALP
jgi:hypothetical protein